MMKTWELFLEDETIDEMKNNKNYKKYLEDYYREYI